MNGDAKESQRPTAAREAQAAERRGAAQAARSEAQPSGESQRLLTPALLANIGKQAPPDRQIATRRDIRKYAIASGQSQRKYLDGDVAPPLFHVPLFWPVVERAGLTPDGVAADPLLPKLPLERGMAGGLDIEYHGEIRAGDELIATRTLTNLYEKAGRSGALIFYEIVMEVRRPSGELVVREKTTRILR